MSLSITPVTDFDAIETWPVYRQIEVAKIHLPAERLAQIDQRLSEEMRDSVARYGLLQPIAVRVAAGKPYDFEIMFGARRLLAWQQQLQAACDRLRQGQPPDEDSPLLVEMQRWELIPAAIYSHQTTDQQMLIHRHVENLHRSNLTPKQRANMQRGYDHISRSQSKVYALAAPLNPVSAEDAEVVVANLVQELHNLHDRIGMRATKTVITSWWRARRMFHNTDEIVLGPTLERLAALYGLKLPLRAIGLWWCSHHPNGRPAWHNDGSISFTTGIRKVAPIAKKTGEP